MSKKNFKLLIQYLGAPYKGWQYQPNERTVQNELEEAFRTILQKDQQKVSLIGSGRTDSGVHALGQVANIIINTSLSSIEIKKAINANISNNIFIKDCIEVDLSFNARFSALKRCYIYKMSNNYSPFTNCFEWYNNYDININLLDEVATLIIGEHDFSSFSKNNPEIKNKKCEIYHSRWKFYDGKMIYEIVGNRFLHHMVRYLVGSMVQVSIEKLSMDSFIDILNNKNKNINLFKAPAHGLYLNEVLYE